MPDQPIQVLLVENNPDDAQQMASWLAQDGLAPGSFNIQLASCLAAGQRCLAAGGIQVVVLAVPLPDADGLTALTAVRTQSPDTIVVLVTSGQPGLEESALAAGAHDCLEKSQLSGVLLRHVLRRAVTDSHTERALAAERNLLRTVIDNLPDFIYVKDTACRFVLNNAAHLRGLGAASQPDVLGKTDYDYQSPELADKFFADEQQVIQSGQALINRQDTFVWPDGRTMTVLCTTVPLRDSHGRLTGVVGITRDISARVEAEDALRHAHDELEQRVRERTVELHDRNTELQERTSELQERTAQLQELMAELELTNQELQDGIAARQRMEEALAAERNLLRTVIDLLPDYIYVKDALGRTVLANLAQARVFGGTTPDKMIGTTDDDYFPPHLAAQTRAAEMSVIQTGQPLINLEEHIIDRTRTHRWVLTSQVPLRDNSGQINGLVGISRDITDHKRLEDNLRQAQRMESVGRLAGGVAHDFNNLVTVINGYSEILLHSLDDESPLRQPLEQIKKAGEQTAAVTRQLLAFSRKQVLQPRTLSLNRLVSDQQTMLLRLIGADVEVVTHLEPELGRVSADLSQLEQVLLNLVLNARDAMPHGGRLTIETANLDVGPGQLDVPQGRYVRLSVADTGEGMDGDTLSHIFEPFFTTKSVGKGTGLGLATVYGIVTQSGGHIRVNSQPGAGARFDIDLPRANGEPAGNGAPARLAPIRLTTGCETILLVEDTVEVRELAARVLQENGYTVLQASSSGDALLVHERYIRPIHLLLTDVIMPILSGPELAQRLTVDRPDMKVLYMSGYNADHRIVQEGVLDPGLAFIQKPFTPADLVIRVRQVLTERSPNSDGDHTLALMTD